MIEEGTFTIFDNSGRELARVSKGSCFGELALMHQASVMINNKRDSTAVPFWSALTKVEGHQETFPIQSRDTPSTGNLQDLRAANVKALTDGVLLALHRDDFNALLGSLTHIRHMWRFEALRKVAHPPLWQTASTHCMQRL